MVKEPSHKDGITVGAVPAGATVLTGGDAGLAGLEDNPLPVTEKPNVKVGWTGIRREEIAAHVSKVGMGRKSKRFLVLLLPFAAFGVRVVS